MYVQYVDLKITVKNFTGTFADKLGMIVCQKSRDVVVYGCGLSYLSETAGSLARN